MGSRQWKPWGNSKKGPRLILPNFFRSCWARDETYPDRKPAEKDKLEFQSLLDSLPEDLLLECLARLPRGSLQTSMMVCQKWRRTLKSGEFYEMRRNIGRLECMLFVFGDAGIGVDPVVYSKSTGVWRSGFLCTMRALQETDWLLYFGNADHWFLHAQPAVVQNKIFILGAALGPHSIGEDCTIVYDSWTETLVRGSPMTCPRKKFACCTIGDRIYVAGGANREDCSREAMMDAEEYIPELDVWRPIANMPKKRYGCVGAAVNGMFYVIGGLMCMQPYAYVGSMDSYNTRTGSWQKTRNLPMGGCVIACTAVGPSIYMLSSLAVELSFWKYDTEGEEFSKIKAPPIPSPLRIDSYLKFSCVTMGNLVYIIQVGGSIDDLLRRSGRQGRGLEQGLVLFYDTISDEWSRGPDLPYVRNGTASAVVLC